MLVLSLAGCNMASFNEEETDLLSQTEDSKDTDIDESSEIKETDNK